MRSDQTRTYARPGVYRVVGTCTVTGERYGADYPMGGLDRWDSGELNQNAMPDVSKADREFLQSGISPKGWRKMLLDEVLHAVIAVDFECGELNECDSFAQSVAEALSRIHLMLENLNEGR